MKKISCSIKRYAAFALLAFVMLCLCSVSCKKNISYKTTDFFSMDTFISITADAPASALVDVEKEIYAIEKQLSATDDRSDINNLYTNNSQTYGDTIELLGIACDISSATNGAFDPTLGALVALWDITGQTPSVPQKADIEEALSHCGYEKIEVSDGSFKCSDKKLSVDLGAIAKGYAGDRAARLLKEKGVSHAALWLGGNVTVIGSSPKNRENGKSGWNVAINSPFDSANLLGTVNINDSTVSVSGNYERFFVADGKVYHHILDRTTGYPSDSGLASCAVISPDGTYADALSTALFVMGLEKGMEFYSTGTYEFEAVFCTSDGKVFVTEGLRERFVPDYSAKNSKGEPLTFENIIA